MEDEVYDMRDDSDANPHDEESSERSLKRPSASVIVIDDSDTEDSSICHVDSYQATASEAKKLRKGTFIDITLTVCVYTIRYHF